MAATATERKLLIDGEWVETGDWIDVRSPYSGDVVGRVAKAGAAEARQAVDAAARALESPLPAHKRAEILVKVAGLIGRRHEEVARTICEEAGKPIKTARVEASRAMSTYTFAAVEARKLAGEMIPMEARRPARASSASRCAGRSASSARSRRSTSRATSSRTSSRPRSPPAAPSCSSPRARRRSRRSFSPSSSTRRGLPAGWLNVLVGPASEIGDVLVEDERVKLITFTGSGEVGWGLQERAPRKRVKLELGNSTPVIVAADADLDVAAAKLAGDAFAFAGQTCISVQRIYVERAVYDAFVQAFVPEGRGAEGRRPRRRRHRRRPGDRRGRAHADPRVDRRGASATGAKLLDRRRGRRR